MDKLRGEWIKLYNMELYGLYLLTILTHLSVSVSLERKVQEALKRY